MKIGILYFTTCFHGFAILRHVDPFVRMLHIYSSLIESHINYCLVLWGTNYDRIFKLKKKLFELFHFTLQITHQSFIKISRNS